jgi:hypothetical protein
MMKHERESLWREPRTREIEPQQQQVGYPRVIGHYPPPPAHHPGYPPAHHPGYPVHGYVAGSPYVAAEYPGTGMTDVGQVMNPQHVVPLPHYYPAPPAHVQHMHGHPIHSPQWRPMNAPGSPPLGEGHVPLPLNPETFGGSWGNTTGGGAPAGTTIIFSSRPQKPFKTSRLLIRGTKSGATAVGNMIGQVFVGTDLQQGEVGNIDLESIGAGNAFDTWISFKQAEPGVWIRVLATLTAFPTGTDFELYTCTAIGHYLH